MKTLIIIIAIAISSINFYAQSFEEWSKKDFATEEDYNKAEKDLVKAVDWLIETPLEKESSKRKEANAFLLKWLTGAPKVVLELKPEIITFVDEGECMLVYMGAYAKKSIETRYESSELENNIAGIEGVLLFYENNKHTLGKIKALEKYKKLQEKGELEDFLSSKL